MSNNTAIKPELVEELLKSLKNPEDLFGATGLFNRLKGALMEKMLEAELASHLGYEHSEKRPEGAKNARNGHSSKNVKTDTGPVDIRVPRDRAGTFEPRLVAKHQRRLEGFDDKVLSLYARGMSVRDIQIHLGRRLWQRSARDRRLRRSARSTAPSFREWRRLRVSRGACEGRRASAGSRERKAVHRAVLERRQRRLPSSRRPSSRPNTPSRPDTCIAAVAR